MFSYRVAKMGGRPTLAYHVSKEIHVFKLIKFKVFIFTLKSFVSPFFLSLPVHVIQATLNSRRKFNVNEVTIHTQTEYFCESEKVFFFWNSLN